MTSGSYRNPETRLGRHRKPPWLRRTASKPKEKK